MENIVRTAAELGNFGTLVRAIKTAGLEGALSGPGPFTVFAPTDDAFNKLPVGVLEGLLEEMDRLSRILAYHVLVGSVTSKDIKSRKIHFAATLGGDNLEISTSILGKIKVNGISVSRADIMCENGVIHVIDGVLLPKHFQQGKAA